MAKLLSRLDFGPTGEDISTLRTIFSIQICAIKEATHAPIFLPRLYFALYASRSSCCCCAVLEDG